MAFGINLSKTDIAKIFAVGIVLVFVVEILFMYMPSSSRGSVAPGDGTVPTSFDTFDGAGTANGTIASYDPILIVVGEDARIAAEISKLKKEGLVTYSSQAQGATIINLASAKDVTGISLRLIGANATVLGDVSISMSNIKVAGADFQRDVPSSTFRYRMPPIFEVGDVIPLSFSAKVVNGQMYTVSNLALPSPEPIITIARPESVVVKAESYRANVPWESRNSMNQQALQGAFGKYGNVTYKLRSFIGITPDAGTAQGQQLSNALPNYALGLQQNILSIVRGYNNSAQVRADLAQYGIEGDFPPSIIEIRPKEGTLSLADLNGAMNSTYGTSYTFQKQYDVEITLPQKVAYGGVEYSLLNSTMMASASRLPSKTALSAFRFTPYGRWGISLEAVSFLEQDLNSTAAPEGNATLPSTNTSAPQAMPALNGTSGPLAGNGSGLQP